MKTDVEGKGEKGRPMRLDIIKNDTKTVWIRVDNMKDRVE